MTDTEVVLQRLQEDIHDHGEVHAVIEEPDAGEFFDNEHDEIELRLGTTTIDTEAELITIEGADTIHRIDADAIIRWYLPVEVAH